MGRRTNTNADAPAAETPGAPEERAATELSPSIRELLLRFTETDEGSTFDRAAFARAPVPAR